MSDDGGFAASRRGGSLAAGPLPGWLLRRLGGALLLLLLVVSATFVVLHALPGDPAGLLLDPRVPPAARAQLRHLWGLDAPLAVQYGRWLADAARGDWGSSFVHHRPAGAVLREALPYTLLLGLAALLVEIAVALPLGVLAARHRGGTADHLLRVGSLLLHALPTFWLGLMALLLLAYRFPLFPAGHAAEATGGGGLDLLRHLALPALVLGLSGAGGLLRLVRGSLLAALPEEPLRAARARGLSEARVVWVHGLRRAGAPLLQLLGLSLPALLGGALVVEVVFSWPGLGRVAYLAVLTRDLPLVLACTAWSGALVVAGSLLADLLTAAADPRQRELLVGG
ncbi:MAG TPA: ABC transporter permease [Thermoanaerobaculia bacterium]|nr:ABC transporter permease [Thermoanaerobaculia bacterium]